MRVEPGASTVLPQGWSTTAGNKTLPTTPPHPRLSKKNPLTASRLSQDEEFGSRRGGSDPDSSTNHIIHTTVYSSILTKLNATVPRTGGKNVTWVSGGGYFQILRHYLRYVLSHGSLRIGHVYITPLPGLTGPGKVT